MNAFDIVKGFEQQLADYCGSKYAVAVDSCSSALLLSCVYHKVNVVTLPKRTYVSVPNAVVLAGGQIKFEDIDWKGAYRLDPYPIIDSARRFYKGMYKEFGTDHVCISFHGKKHLNIGRGGAILLDDLEAVEWYKRARFDGRKEGVPVAEDIITVIGYHCYMHPEMAAAGMNKMLFVKDTYPDLLDHDPDLSLQPIYKDYIV